MEYDSKRGPTQHTLRLAEADLLAILRRSSIQAAESLLKAAGMTVQMTITVPSGGDYSGDSLELDEVGGLTVVWETQE